MKKISSVLLFILICLVKIYAMDGDGSSSNPFRGSLSVSEQWSIGEFTGNTVYVGTSAVPDLTVTTGGHLTIDPGITVIFTQLSSDLYVTGTGQLTAGGGTLAVIFTKDSGNGHWGHISFQNMGTSPASSTLDNCILEYGYSTGTDQQPLLAGGVLQVDFNDVVVNKCIFRYNFATFGGAMIVNSNRNTLITNCYFLSNDSYECAGALLLNSGSSARIENTIFEDNYSQGYTYAFYGGGAIWSNSNSSKITNCTFVENNSDRPGDALYSYSAQNMTITNSIFWGSNDQFSGSSSGSTFVTCAFETSKPSSASNSIIISNTASDHFIDASTSNWTLKFISPCLDAGTIPTPAVDYDYVGNPRIYSYDIGAYEVQYSRWKTTATSTDWTSASNWDGGVPTNTRDVLIPTGAANYPTGSSSQDYTIGTGKQLLIDQGARVTLHNLTNNGTLKLNHAQNASGFASLILNSYARGTGGTEEIQLYLIGGGSELLEDYKWHYISSPVTSLSTNTFTGATLDLAQFVESRPSTSLLDGWVAYDGYVYSTGVSNGPTFNTLSAGKGYNFWDGTNNSFTFSGILNTSDVPVSVSYSAPLVNLRGFNLIGNPFSSGLDWDVIANGAGFPANTSKGAYFTRDNVQCTYIAGVGTPGDVTGIIPPMQGFFVKTYSSGNTITLSASARTHNGIHARYKSGAIIPLVRLELRKDQLSSDETVVRFDENAKTDLDYDFDAVKMFPSGSETQIYTLTGGTNYAINGQPFPSALLEIPVAVTIKKDTIHKISATQLQGLENYSVSLIDNITGFTANLKTNPVVTFSAAPGTITDRFVLQISNTPTGIGNPELSEKSFNIYAVNNLINIQVMSDGWDGKTGTVKVWDLAGRTIAEKRDVEFYRNSLVQVSAPGLKGLYIVELKSGVERFVGKVVVK